MTTTVNPNDYKFEIKTTRQGQIAVTNATTRIWKQRELVVYKDANDKCFIGFVATNGGIAASGGTGHIDLLSEQEVATNQFTAAVFVPGDTTVYISIQTNSVAALITQATAVGKYALNALIISYSETGVLRLRMPTQDGTIIAIV